jgi:F-type H+-transporting ATPase subunit epsilon
LEKQVAEQSIEITDFNCKIITPEKSVYSGKVRSLKAVGKSGALEINPRHEPLMTPLEVCLLEIDIVDNSNEGEFTTFAVHGGFLDMDGENAVILADTAEPADSIDLARAQKALARAKERLEDVSGSADEIQIDIDRAKLAMLRALMRLKAGGESVEQK